MHSIHNTLQQKKNKDVYFKQCERIPLCLSQSYEDCGNYFLQSLKL